MLPSFSFQISFNWWLLILTLYGVYRTASHMMSLKMAGYLTVFLSAVPAITNMSITAKTDIITLLFQVLMIEELIRSRKGEAGEFWEIWDYGSRDGEWRVDGGSKRRISPKTEMA